MKPETSKIEHPPEAAPLVTPEHEVAREDSEMNPETPREEQSAPLVEETPPTPTVAGGTVSPSGHGSISHDKLLTGIERILEENLAEAHQSLPPDVARAFKEKGEETAVTIRDLVSRATVKVRAIVKAISDWLKMLPGINRFFLIQETKLKTDRILELKDWLQKNGP
ncbi:MAG: hypothetical protein AAB562_03080 [Patescibacteria group bacterium]